MSDHNLSALYVSMSTAELLDLRAAFEADMAGAVRLETIAFCVGRLALIADVLGRRAKTA